MVAGAGVYPDMAAAFAFGYGIAEFPRLAVLYAGGSFFLYGGDLVPGRIGSKELLEDVADRILCCCCFA